MAGVVLGRGPSAALLQRENRACVSRFPPRLTLDRPLRYRRWRPCLQKRCRSSFPDRDGCSEWYKTAFVRETPRAARPLPALPSRGWGTRPVGLGGSQPEGWGSGCEMRGASWLWQPSVCGRGSSWAFGDWARLSKCPAGPADRPPRGWLGDVAVATADVQGLAAGLLSDF